MRDLGVFTSKPISSHELVEFVRAYSLHLGQPFEKHAEDSVIGSAPNVLYVFHKTAPDQGYFSEEEKAVIESKLASTAEGYVSIHFASTDAALNLAEGMAQEICRIWKGIIDYSGTGGELGVPPVRRAEDAEG